MLRQTRGDCVSNDDSVGLDSFFRSSLYFKTLATRSHYIIMLFDLWNCSILWSTGVRTLLSAHETVRVVVGMAFWEWLMALFSRPSFLS